ncbi:MAG: ABC transporter permease [Chloroflexi bacterium]|nr:ABC transporter permease [Chloroflexota bacterium]
MGSEARREAPAFPLRSLERWLGRGSVLRRVMRRRVNAVATVVMLVVLLAAILAPLIATRDPIKTQPYRNHRGLSTQSWLGTDYLGRDMYSRLVYGARVSVQVGLGAVGLALAIGVPLGLLAAFRGGIVDEVIMRAMDAVFSVPALLLAVSISAALGASLGSVMIALAVSGVPRDARLMRGAALSVKENDYVLASRAMGVSGARIALVHILPNAIQPLIVQAAISIGFAIFGEASLSFLGVGVRPPLPSWGSMLREGYPYMEINLVESFAPGMAIFLTVLAVNLVGDGLREALDPRLRGT